MTRVHGDIVGLKEMKEVLISKSSKPDKRLVAQFPNKKMHFGARGGSTFVDHKNIQTKKAWEARHRVNEDWGDFESAGALSKHVLWNKSTLKSSVSNLNSKQKQFKFRMS